MNMRKLASSLLACAALGWAAVTPATSVASALLLDNTPTGTVTHETRGPATNGYPGVILTRIDVGGSNVSIDQFGVFGQQLGSGNVQFAVFDITQTRLYASGLIATATATGHQWYDSPIFALTLNANSTYYFGLVSDQNFDYDWSLDSPADSANGLTSPAGLSSGNNGNFGDIGNPVVFDYCCGVQQSVRIFGGAAAPEPASLALLGLGLAGLGFSRRKKS